MSTFVAVGNANQPFNRLIECVVRHSSQLPGPVFIQYGSANLALGDCQGIDFLKMDEFERHVADATLLIMHAGAGSVIHAIRAGKTPVVMARLAEFDEHVDNHQVEFTTEMATTGTIVVCSDPEQLVSAATKAMKRQNSVSSEAKPPVIIEMVKESLKAALQKRDSSRE